jgi:hypothetical protein
MPLGGRRRRRRRNGRNEQRERRESGKSRAQRCGRTVSQRTGERAEVEGETRAAGGERATKTSEGGRDGGRGGEDGLRLLIADEERVLSRARAVRARCGCLCLPLAAPGAVRPASEDLDHGRTARHRRKSAAARQPRRAAGPARLRLRIRQCCAAACCSLLHGVHAAAAAPLPHLACSAALQPLLRRRCHAAAVRMPRCLHSLCRCCRTQARRPALALDPCRAGGSTEPCGTAAPQLQAQAAPERSRSASQQPAILPPSCSSSSRSSASRCPTALACSMQRPPPPASLAQHHAALRPPACPLAARTCSRACCEPSSARRRRQPQGLRSRSGCWCAAASTPWPPCADRRAACSSRARGRRMRLLRRHRVLARPFGE